MQQMHTMKANNEHAAVTTLRHFSGSIAVMVDLPTNLLGSSIFLLFCNSDSSLGHEIIVLNTQSICALCASFDLTANRVLNE
jgi:hypothetical protein